MTGKKLILVLVILLCVCLTLLGVYSISTSSRTSTNEQDLDIEYDVDTIMSYTDTLLCKYNQKVVYISILNQNTINLEDSIGYGQVCTNDFFNIKNRISPIIKKNGLDFIRKGHKIFSIRFRVNKKGEIIYPTLIISREHYKEFNPEKYHEILVYIQKISLADIYKYDCDNILTIPVYRHSTINHP